MMDKEKNYLSYIIFIIKKSDHMKKKNFAILSVFKI